MGEYSVDMSSIPHLQDTPTAKQLIVHGKPFLMLAGELQNSSLTSAEFMAEHVWQNMKATHVNTLLGCVTWEMIEPQEGNFDFSVLDDVLLGARANDMHLVLLWFGSFKNGISTYAPSWVKQDTKRFPRAKLRKAGGVLRTSDTMSIFHPEGVKADAKAFRTLMAHLREFDERHSTVLMVQVENETGLLGDSRDGGAAANKKFKEPVPSDLTTFLSSDWEALHPDLKVNLQEFKANSKKSGSWEETFGKGPKTDELFMAYHLALYLGKVAAAGREEYPIPLYTNVWQNYIGDDGDGDKFPVIAGGGGEPGDYPSGGGTSNVLDVWQQFSGLDFIAPDVYLNDYASSCSKYRHRNQAFFIPEQRRDEYGARRIWTAYGSYQAMGVAPFGIDTLEASVSPFTRHYGLLDSVSALVLDAQRRPGSMVGFFFDELSDVPDTPDPTPAVVHQFGDYVLKIERTFVFGKAGPGAGIVIHQGGGKFLLVGWGFHVEARASSPTASFTGILSFEEKVVEDKSTGKLRTLRRFNGDETRSGIYAMMPNEDPDYGGFPICVTVPAKTMIAELEVYHIEESEDVD